MNFNSWPGKIVHTFIGPFDNGWSLSVIAGNGLYSDLDADPPTYEVCVLNSEGKPDYAHTNGDVLAYQTVEQIDSLACRIRNISK